MSDPDWSDHCGDMWRSHVLTATGRDICDVVGPSPRRPRDWVALMRRVGVRDMAGVISAVHGPAIAIRQARRGDIVKRGWAIGVCRGDRAEFYGGDVAPMADVDGAWHIAPSLSYSADLRESAYDTDQGVSAHCGGSSGDGFSACS